MKNKQGISLIVLVITIIVMVILAATVVITLSNTGIINKANEAVNKTNKKQIEQLATLAWSEAFMDGARTEEEFKKAVEEALKDVDTSGYEIIVTDKGVIVQDKEDAPKLNEYGFYYNQLYTGTIAENPTGIESIALVFHEDGSAEGYAGNDFTSGKKILLLPHEAGTLNYANKTITIADGEGSHLTVSEDGLTMTGMFEGVELTVECTFEKMHGAYRNRVYSATNTELGDLEVILDNNNRAKMYVDGVITEDITVTLSHNEHLIKQGIHEIGYLSTDGEKLILIVDATYEIIFTLTNRTTPTIQGGDEVSSEWVVAWTYKDGAWSDRILPGGDATGDFVAKLYPMNKTIQPVGTNNNDFMNYFITYLGITEGTAYKMVIEGNGDIPTTYETLVDDEGLQVDENAYAWQKDSYIGMLIGKYGDMIEPYYTFYITDLQIEEGITGIGEGNFAYLPSLKNVEFASSVERIGASAFEYSGIESIKWPSALKEIGDYAFMYTEVNTANIPNNLTKIGRGIFTDCEQLTRATLPDNITEVPAYIFSSCAKLTSVYIPDSVKVIGDGAFAYSGLSSFNWPANLQVISLRAFSNTNVTAGNIPSTVKTIGDEAFASCKGLTILNVPSSVTSIGKAAFSNCSGLINITLNNYGTIPDSCFYKCTSLNTLSISTNVTSLETYCFKQCSSLTNVIIPSSVNYIGSSVFIGCTQLMTVDICSTRLELGVQMFMDMPAGSTIYIVKNALYVGLDGAYTISLKEKLNSADYYYNSDNTTIVEK